MDEIHDKTAELYARGEIIKQQDVTIKEQAERELEYIHLFEDYKTIVSVRDATIKEAVGLLRRWRLAHHDAEKGDALANATDDFIGKDSDKKEESK